MLKDMSFTVDTGKKIIIVGVLVLESHHYLYCYYTYWSLGMVLFLLIALTSLQSNYNP